MKSEATGTKLENPGSKQSIKNIISKIFPWSWADGKFSFSFCRRSRRRPGRGAASVSCSGPRLQIK